MKLAHRLKLPLESFVHSENLSSLAKSAMKLSTTIADDVSCDDASCDDASCDANASG